MNYAANLRKWYERATEQERAEGARWYDTAHARAVHLAHSTGKDVETVAAVIAALSPRITWEENLLGAEMLLRTGKSARIAGFRTNRDKALRIRNGADVRDVLGGDKVTAFYLNILGDRDAVTVDGWAALAAGMNALDAKRLHRRGRYERIAQAYRKVAKELGYEARQFQAIVWLAIRRIESESASAASTAAEGEGY